MIRKTVQKKTKSKSVENTSIKKLSIQFSLGGFSFCIANRFHHVQHFSTYIFDEKPETPEQLLENIELIFKNDALLQEDFSSIFVIHQNNLSTVVPNAFFDENKLKDYLNYTIKILKTDFIAFDDLSNIKAKNIYIPYVNINNYLFQNFGEFDYRHHSSVLIDKLLERQKTRVEKEMYVHVSNDHMDIIVIQKQQLILSNTFSFKTKEDFIYYILFTAEQLGLHPEKFPLIFLGDIEKDTDIYTITYQFIKNVTFIENDTPFFKDETDFPEHSNFILLG